MSKTNKNSHRGEDRLKDPKRKHEHREDRRNIKKNLEDVLACLDDLDEIELNLEEKEKI